MSYQTEALLPCQSIQGRLEDLWMTPSWPGADDRMPLSDALNSNINRYPIQTALTPGNAKANNVIVTYFPRLTEDLVDENTANPLCSATNKYGNISRTYTPPEDNLTSSKTISIGDLTRFCGDNSTYFEQRLAYHIDVLERKLATQQSQETVLLYGSWGNGTLFPEPSNTPGGVNASEEYVWRTRFAPTAGNTNGAPDPEAWSTLRMAFDDLGTGDVMLFGGKTGRSYFNASMIGCCTDDGTDLGEALARFGMSYAYDTRLATALGSQNKFMAITPGSIVPIYFVASGWKDGVTPIIYQAANYTHMSITSPRWGVPMDLSITDVCGEISIAVTVTSKLINLPADFYSTPDVYAGKNGVNKVLITNPT